MICSNCQAEAQDYPFCPHCGHRLRDPREALAQGHAQVGRPARRARLPGGQRAFPQRWLFVLLVVTVIVAFGILALALVGFRDGLRDRSLAAQRRAEVHYNRGLIYLEWGQYPMAAAEFEEAIRLVPDYGGAQESLRLAQLKQTVTPSPTPLPSPTPTATPALPTPTPERVIVPVTQILFGAGREQFEKQQWAKAISTFEQLRDEDITYRADEVVSMLFQSHRSYGLQLEEEGNLEEAVSHYDSALYLRKRDPEVEELRQRADLYMRALGFWSADWQRVIVNLTALYALAPKYRDTAERLYQASTLYGQALIRQERYCDAAAMFGQALEIRGEDPSIAKLADDTQHLCRVTKQTPVPTLSPDGVSSGTVHLGTLIATCYDHRTNQYSVCAQNAEDNVLRPWIPLAEQPAVTLDGRAIIYRSTDPARPGLYAVTLTNSGTVSGTVVPHTVYTVTTEGRVSSPTWAPDGKRIAYSQYDAQEKDWFIYIAYMGSKEAPRRAHQGEWPNWGPNGLLVFTTCSGRNACGLHALDLSSWRLTKLTDSIQDRAAFWSPSGMEIAYMSDIGRSFNLYVANVETSQVFVRQLTRNLFEEGFPVWSPDGQCIAYVTNRDDDWAVYTLHPSFGEQQKRIADLGEESADWMRMRLAWIAPILRFPPSR